MTTLMASCRRGRLPGAVGAVLATVLVVTLSPVASAAHAAPPESHTTAELVATGSGATTEDPAAGLAAATDGAAKAVGPGVAVPGTAGEVEPVDVVAPAWDVVFDRILTRGLYANAVIGRVAMLAYCDLIVVGALRPVCRLIANSNHLVNQLIRLGPPNNRCLRVFPRFGVPPYGLQYVSCP